MKKVIGIIVLVLLLAAAKAPKEEPNKNLSIEGTWELVSFHHYEDNKIAETLPTADGYRQIKMYYNGKVMWTRYVPKDSLEWFGYGTYSTTADSLTEHLEYMSASMKSIAGTLETFHFELDLQKDKYSQISFDEEGNRTFSENYIRLD